MTPQQLKNSILQQAVEGKLVEQRPEEGTGEELYQRIQKEKQKLIKEGKIKKEKPLPPITDGEIPFEIPENWKWMRLCQLGIFSSGKTPSMQNKEYWENGSIPWITSKDMKFNILKDSQMHITKKAAMQMNMYPKGTLLMVVRSGILKRHLPLCILGIDSTINQDIKAFSLIDSKLSKWIYYVLLGREPYIIHNLVKHITTVESLKFKEFENMLIPLPPLKEQKRIVAKVEELLPLCEQLKKTEES